MLHGISRSSTSNGCSFVGKNNVGCYGKELHSVKMQLGISDWGNKKTTLEGGITGSTIPRNGPDRTGPNSHTILRNGTDNIL